MSTNKYLNLDGLLEYDALIKAFINSKIFVGTYEQYETANADGKIPVGALVIITDDGTSGGGSSGGDNTSSTTAILGQAILGQMILG